MTSTPESTTGDETRGDDGATAVPETEAPETSQAPETEAAQPQAPDVEAPEPAVEETSGVVVEAAETSAAEAGSVPEAPEAEATEPAAEVEAAPAAEADPAAEPEAAPEEPTPAPTPAPAAAPSPRPVPRPLPRPRPVPRPDAAGSASSPVIATPVTPTPAAERAEIEAASAFGSVADDGTVTVRDGENERVVGQFATGGDGADALGLYVRRYLDLKAQVALLETRLPTITVKEATSTLATLTEQLVEPAAVGDLPALRTRLAALQEQASALQAEAQAARDAARAQAVTERTAIVEQVEEIAATDPSRIQWRDATAKVTALLDEWKTAQRAGVRIDRPTEDALWKRFSHARTSFDKARRAHFSELDRRNGDAKGVKEQLVTRAEALVGSTDWGPTGSQFRGLMDEWRAAPRGRRKDDDALWARFKAAQDAFFGARTQANAEIDSAYEGNLEVKLGLLTQAEALLPIKDLTATRNKLRQIQDAWDEAGKVPRADIQRTEARLRAVEQAVRDAEQAEMRRTDPEMKARVEGATAQLLDSITALEADLAAAQAAGNARKVKDAEAALATRRQWLDAVKRSHE